MTTIATHLWSRLRAMVSEPMTVTIVLISSLTTLLVWPGPSDPTGAGWVANDEPRLYAVLQIMLIWVFVWPVLVSRASGQMVGPMHHLTVMPTLPIGFRARAIAEALAVLVAVLFTRFVGVYLVDWVCLAFELPRQPTSESSFWLEFIRHSFFGALLMLPLLIACASPAQTMGVYWLRPLVWVGLLLGALRFGWLTAPSGCIAVSLLLTSVALAIAGRELPLPQLKERRAPGPERRWRPACEPERQLRHDLWTRPLESIWPLIVAVVVFQVLVVLIDDWYVLPRLSFYLGTTVTASVLFGTLVLRPLGSVQATASFKGAPGYQHGDFIDAWSILPVRREAVLRGVFLHGLIAGTFVWMLVIGANFGANWLETGEWCLIDHDGDPVGWILWPSLVIVPCLAGFLTAGAVGNPPLAFLSFLSAIAYLPLRIVFREASQLSSGGANVTLILLLIAGVIPAFVYLRKPSARPKSARAAGRPANYQQGAA